jgi:hypothetical protein
MSRSLYDEVVDTLCDSQVLPKQRKEQRDAAAISKELLLIANTESEEYQMS